MPYFPAQADPACNANFRRRWVEPAHHLSPNELDRLADTELFFGRAGSAEHFSRRAEAMRLREPRRVGGSR